MTPRELLHAAFRAGAADLRRRRALLDRINVFPVVDGDTGANMLETTTAAERAIAAPGADVARALLLGARGNSGVILAQFLVGMFDELGPGDRFDAAGLVGAFARGRELAYGAVATPVEGTILTVMSDLVAILGDLGPHFGLATHAEIEGRLAAAVARTPELMPRLAEAGVVDSGALGFHILAAGLTLALPALDGEPEAVERIAARHAGRDTAPLGRIAEQIDPAFLRAARGDDDGYRYCVDLVIDLRGEPSAGWTDRISALGASVELVRRDRLVKLHVHCGAPDAVRGAAAELGELISVKVEDMTEGLIRVRAAAADVVAEPVERLPVVLLGDSSMSLDHELAREIGVRRLENYVNVHGEMVRDSDLDLPALFARMREGHFYTTAQCSAAEVRDLLDRELGRADRVLYLAVGRAYTGTQELVRKAVADHPEGARVTVLDTHAASGQQGLALLATARRLAAGADLEDLRAYAVAQIESCREYLVIDDLRYLVRTGRIGRIKAAFAGALSVRPIVGHGSDGAVTHAKVRSQAAALDEVVRRVAAHPGAGSLLALVEHTDDLARADEVAARLREALPADAEILRSPLSSTSAVHMGPGTWGVAVTRLPSP